MNNKMKIIKLTEEEHNFLLDTLKETLRNDYHKGVWKEFNKHSDLEKVKFKEYINVLKSILIKIKKD